MKEMPKDAKSVLGEEYPLTTVTEKSKTKEKILLETTLLFAQNGYAAVSMKEIAEKVGIKPASLYNHFSSKEALWNEILQHIETLYRLYFSRLKDSIQPGQTLEEILENMFVELKTVVSIFAYYGFSLVQTEQFRDETCGRIFLDVFLKDSIRYIAEQLDQCIEKGLAKEFDTQAVATLLMHSVLIGNNLRVHEDLGRNIPYNVSKMFQTLQYMVLDLVSVDNSRQ